MSSGAHNGRAERPRPPQLVIASTSVPQPTPRYRRMPLSADQPLRPRIPRLLRSTDPEPEPLSSHFDGMHVWAASRSFCVTRVHLVWKAQDDALRYVALYPEFHGCSFPVHTPHVSLGKYEFVEEQAWEAYRGVASHVVAATAEPMPSGVRVQRYGLTPACTLFWLASFLRERLRRNCVRVHWEPGLHIFSYVLTRPWRPL